MTHAYAGAELELFAGAANWKSYVARVLAPFVAGRVLEVGAGLGANIPHLCSDRVSAWTSLEPDPALAGRIAETARNGALPARCRVAAGTIASIAPAARFDTILYIDVLEHIEDDRGELARAAGHLAPGGHLVVLAPAHGFLFSAFDAAIGHYRRYGVGGLAALTPPGCRLHASLLLDSAGFFASLANAVVLRAAAPSPTQIRLWDGWLVPVSEALDRLTGHRFGKTIVAAWRRGAEDRRPVAARSVIGSG